MKNTYFNIKNYSKEISTQWDRFVLQSTNDAWLWHLSASLDCKSFWTNYYNKSFYIIDNSNKDKISAVIPLFYVKRKKLLFDYSSLESLGGPALLKNLSKQKVKKINQIINCKISNLMSNLNLNKFEVSYSPLSKYQINEKRVIANPLLNYINKDLSTSSWILNLKENTYEKSFENFDPSAKTIIKRSEKNLKFYKIDNFSQIFYKKYLELHNETTKRNNIKKINSNYFKYIFFKFPKSNKRVYFTTHKNEILNFLIFGIFNGSASYWTNVCSQKGLDLGSNFFCFNEAIKDLKKSKINFLETGEAFIRTNDKKKIGLNNFKKSFGCDLYPYFKGERIKNNYKELLFQFFYNIKSDVFKN